MLLVWHVYRESGSFTTSSRTRIINPLINQLLKKLKNGFFPPPQKVIEFLSYSVFLKERDKKIVYCCWIRLGGVWSWFSSLDRVQKAFARPCGRLIIFHIVARLALLYCDVHGMCLSGLNFSVLQVPIFEVRTRNILYDPSSTHLCSIVRRKFQPENSLRDSLNCGKDSWGNASHITVINLFKSRVNSCLSYISSYVPLDYTALYALATNSLWFLFFDKNTLFS